MSDRHWEMQRVIETIASANDSLKRENATLRRNSEALRKRLADAERKLQPGDVSPDMHACERAIRDLELLERVRANANIGWWVNDLRRSLDSCGKRSEYHALLADLCALLSPGDAGRGEGA